MRTIRIAAATALVGLTFAAAEARASDTGPALVGAAVIGLVGADIAFAAHGLDGAAHNQLARDDWLTAEVIVAGPQALGTSVLLTGFNAADDRELGTIASALGIIPTACVNALTIHGAWGLADAQQKVPADALAGVSTMLGLNSALTLAAAGRLSRGHLHSRPIGILTTILATPGTAVGVYESTFQRPEQGRWIALTAWSGALLVHGVASALISDEDDEPPPAPPPPPPPDGPVLQRAAKREAPTMFSIAPTVLSDGVARMPGVVAVGTF
ncbi:MAG: hypothetical protein U0441_28735 [Polyangiaceae bacterium]